MVFSVSYRKSGRDFEHLSGWSKHILACKISLPAIGQKSNFMYVHDS